jgi:tetratricopeptide (TPR) repeat protein/O-antigen ligase
VLIIPVFFNIHSERIFEEEKVPLLRSLALCALAALVVLVAERGRAALRVRGRSLWSVPLVRPAAAFTGAYVLATILSVNPRLSWFGAYLRQQGLYTWLAYPLFFLVTVLLVRRRRQVERVVAAMLVAGAAVALHALLQLYGYDPLPWGGSFDQRAYGPGGNPIFLGAFLIVVIPITSAWLYRAARSVPRRRWGRAGKWIVILALLIPLAAELGALILAASRGPVVGLAAAILVLALVQTARAGWRRFTIVLVAGAVTAGIFFAGVSQLASSRVLESLGAQARFARLFDLQRGSGKVRVLIWQSAADAFTASPWHAVFGYGPETFLSVVNPYYPPELAYYESRRVLPDRAHDSTFDALITTGLIGCAAEVAFYIALFAYAFGILGLIDGASQRRRFLFLSAGGAVAGAILPWLADGRPRYSGFGLSLGLYLGVVSYLIVRSLAGAPRATRHREPEKLLVAGLVAAAAGHLIETSVGIPLAATRLYLWVAAGLVVALGLRVEHRPAARDMAPSRMPAWGFAIAGLLVALTYDGYSPTVSRQSVRFLAQLLIPTWLLGACLEASLVGTVDRRHLSRYFLSSLLPWACFTTLFVWWAHSLPQTGPDPLTTAADFGKSMTHLLSIVYVAVVAVVLCSALNVARARRDSGAPLARSSAMLAAYAVLALGIAVTIATSNLSSSRADILNKQGKFYETKGQNDTAARMYEEALALRPHTDVYAANLGRVLSIEGSRLAPIDAARADAYMHRAEVALERAYEMRPRYIDHPRNIARLHNLWASLLKNEEARAVQFAAAERWYQRTLQVAPTHAAVLNEWALMYFETHDTDRALQMLGRSIEIDPRYTTTYWIRGNVRANVGDLEGALADYNRALEIDDRLLPALSGKGAVLLRMGRLDDAIAANKRATEVRKTDFISRKNLAVLYRDKGDLENSLEQAKIALGFAPANEKQALQEFIADLESRRASPPPAAPLEPQP